jgi:RNA polymerase sigma-70 factor (ECF subfamily)
MRLKRLARLPLYSGKRAESFCPHLASSKTLLIDGERIEKLTTFLVRSEAGKIPQLPAIMGLAQAGITNSRENLPRCRIFLEITPGAASKANERRPSFQMDGLPQRPAAATDAPSPGRNPADAASQTPASAPASEQVGGVPEFSSLVDQYQSGLLRYVGRMLSPAGQVAGEAEDVVQETFLRLHRQMSREGLDSIRNLNAWLYRVAHNLAISERRKRLRERQMQDQVIEDERVRTGEDELDGLGELVRRAACERALEELGKLSDTHREVLLLKVIQGMTLREIGDVLGLTPGNVAYRVNQGLRELARRLKDAGIV